MARFEIFDTGRSAWRWRLLDESGHAIAVGAADRPTADACRPDIDALRTTPPERFRVARVKSGDWGWSVAGASGERHAVSPEGYSSREECEQRALVVTVAVRGATVVVRSAPGPAPAVRPPELDPSVASPVPTATEFLYTGKGAQQTGVAPGAIDLERVCVLRGKVLDRDNGRPLGGARVRVADHPEYGSTHSRDDGMFELAVNGGGQLGLRYEREGMITATRVVDLPRQDFLIVPDVALVARAASAAELQMSGEAAQLVETDSAADASGKRASALVAPAGVSATAVAADGRATRRLENLTVRATEFSVGDVGLQAMPAELPPSSGYTYAVELSADEADGPLEFSDPFVHYVENFLGFPVGGKVPVGYYDRSQLAWVPAPDGRIVQVLDAEDGLAQLDIDGSGAAADESALEELGVTEQERRHVAQAFPSGTQLWRVPIAHFSPWDYNWPYGPPDDAAKPENPPPNDDDAPPDACPLAGSIIDVAKRALGEAFPVSGTGYELCYRSDRAPGRRAAFGLDVTLSGSRLPRNVKRIDFELHVAGRLYCETREPQPNQAHRVEWDGRDPWGRALQGQHRARVRTGYVYKATYREPEDFEQSFARLAGTEFEGNFAREEVTLWQESRHLLGVWTPLGLGLGGWSLDVHHVYDTASGVVQLGSGGRLKLGEVAARITTVAGMVDPDAEVPEDSMRASDMNFPWPSTVEADRDGGFYVAGTRDHEVRHVGADGATRLLTRTSNGDFGGDGGPAAKAMLNGPTDLALGPRGELYVADSDNNRIRVIEPDGERIIKTFAGGSRAKFKGDGGPATAAGLNGPLGVACGPDGSVYIADTGNGRVRRVTTDGTISTVAGGGDDPNAGSALELSIEPVGVAVTAEGALLIADPSADKVFRVTPDGAAAVFAGTGEMLEDGEPNGDGALAVAARLGRPVDLNVARDGAVFVACAGEHRVRRIGLDGVIRTIVGNGRDASDGDGGAPEEAAVGEPKDVVVTADGAILVADFAGDRIRRVTPPIAGFKLGDHLIHSGGSELYRFDSNGRHLATLDARTGAVVRAFAYDGTGRLASIEESNGDRTQIERSGAEIKIVGPRGHRTRLTTGSDGYLTELRDPTGAATRLEYAPGGLLRAVTDGGGGTRRFDYDDLGRLAQVDAADGGSLSLATRETPDGRASAAVSKSGRESRLSTVRGGDGETVLERACCGQQPTRVRTRHDGTTVSELPDGSVETTHSSGSPAQGYVRTTRTLTTPGGRKTVATVETTVQGELASVDQETTVVDIDGRRFRSVIDPRARVQTSTSPEGRVQRTTWDEHRRLIGVEVPGRSAITARYDGLRRTLSVGERRGVTELAADGRTAAITDATGARTEVSYDEAARPIERRATDATTAFTWDGAGSLASVRAPNGGLHAFEHTGRGLLAAYRPPSGAPVELTHSLDGRLLRASCGEAGAVDFSRDEAEELVGVTMPGARISYQRDAAGRIAGASTDAGQSLEREFDGPLLVRESWSGAVKGVVKHLFGDDMRPGGVVVGKGAETAIEYDADGAIVRVGELQIERDAATGVVVRTAIGVIEETFGLNAYGELVDHRVLVNGSETYRFEYERDTGGRVTAARERGPEGESTRSFSYDRHGQLVEAVIDEALERYTYDPNGNRIAVERGGQRIDAAFDDADRLVSFDGRRFDYRDDGSRAHDGERALDYDLLGALRGVERPGAPSVTYVVDGLGRRVGRRLDGRPEKGLLYLDRSRPVAELDADNRVVSRFAYGTRLLSPEYITRRGSTYRVVTDHLGSPVLVLDAETGEVAQRLRYDAFGRVLVDSRPGFQPFGFCGGLYDELTGLVRFGTRDYDAETGCWMTRDLPQEDVFDTNAYRYAGGDPANQVDPDGRRPRPYPLPSGPRPRPCPQPGEPIWEDPAWTPDPGELRDLAEEKEEQLIGGHYYQGGFAHCLAACLAQRWYTPWLGVPLVLGFGWGDTADFEPDAGYDRAAELLGIAASTRFSGSCTSNCAEHFPPPACGRKGAWKVFPLQ